MFVTMLYVHLGNSKFKTNGITKTAKLVYFAPEKNAQIYEGKTRVLQ